MRLRGYLMGDEARVNARADFVADYRAAGGVLPDGPKVSLLDDAGAVLGVAGFSRIAPRQWGAWAYLAEMAPRQWVRAARRARLAIIGATGLLDGGCSIYATPADTDAAQRLLASIGFRPSVDDAGIWKFEGAA
jgi:hypothetical protein